MQKLTRTCSSNTSSLDFLILFFSWHYIISTTIGYMHRLCFLYMPTSHKSGVNMQETCVFLSKIEIPSYQLLSHPMPEYVDD